MSGPPFLREVRVARALQPLTDAWRRVGVEPRGATLLGISYRPLQAQAFGLDPHATLQRLLAYPFDLIRLGAYWNSIEPAPGERRFDALDWQVDAAERAGKRILLTVGAVKSFGYPECFIPVHYLRRPLREGALVEPTAHAELVAGALAFITQVIERYRSRPSIVGWQVEHEAVDPLGVEHSWRLSESFVQAEVDAARAADSSRPILMNGFLPTSALVRTQQHWRTRDQGDSLAVAQRLADIVGIDYYPRHAVVSAGPYTVYLNGDRGESDARRRNALLTWSRGMGRRVMVTEGQGEPWETITTPPNPELYGMYSCLPERVIENYNTCMRWPQAALYAYLFWGAEYWLLREASGDPRYMQAFARVLASS